MPIGEADDRRQDDANDRDQEGVEEADDEGAAEGAGRAVVDQRLADVEPGRPLEEAEAAGHAQPGQIAIVLRTR